MIEGQIVCEREKDRVKESERVSEIMLEASHVSDSINLVSYTFSTL